MSPGSQIERRWQGCPAIISKENQWQCRCRVFPDSLRQIPTCRREFPHRLCLFCCCFAASMVNYRLDLFGKGGGPGERAVPYQGQYRLLWGNPPYRRIPRDCQGGSMPFSRRSRNPACSRLEVQPSCQHGHGCVWRPWLFPFPHAPCRGWTWPRELTALPVAIFLCTRRFVCYANSSPGDAPDH